MTAPWPRNAMLGPDGLAVAGHLAEDLALEYGTPLLVVDEEHFRARCREFREAFGRVLWAVKAFPAQAFMRLALEEGLGLLASTGGELDACLRAGSAPERVALHGNNKADREIELAVETGVGLLILDQEEEAERVDRAAAAAGVVQPVLLRLAPGVDVDAHPYVKTGAPDTKFGTPIAAGVAMSALKAAQGLEHLSVRGLHVHLGSQLLDARPYVAGLDAILDFLSEARDALGFEARVLDVGGGMGVTYTDERPVTPAELAVAVEGQLARGCAARGLPVPELVVEPGRAISGNSAVTLYTVGSIKDVPGIRTYVAVDGGMSDNIRPVLYGARYTIGLASRRSTAEERYVTVVGRHCESGDELARDVLLPADLARGDLLAFASTGAYEYAMASNYNKTGRPAVLLVTEEEARLVLRREDEGDLSRLEVGGGPIPDAPPPPEVELRPARARDARSLIELLVAVAAEGRFIRMERVAWTVRQTRKRLRPSWTRGGAHIVAVTEGRVIGHLGVGRETVSANAHVASLGMAVAEDWRSKGVGAALLAECFRWARWARVEKLTLTVFPHNTAAMALYRKFGFVQEGRLSGHSKKSTGYQDEVVMGRWL